MSIVGQIPLYRGSRKIALCLGRYQIYVLASVFSVSFVTRFVSPERMACHHKLYTCPSGLTLARLCLSRLECAVFPNCEVRRVVKNHFSQRQKNSFPLPKPEIKVQRILALSCKSRERASRMNELPKLPDFMIEFVTFVKYKMEDDEKTHELKFANIVTKKIGTIKLWPRGIANNFWI